MEKTTNGIPYHFELSVKGAHFTLYPQPGHTKQQIKDAEKELRAERDVVKLSISMKLSELINRFGKAKNVKYKTKRK